MLSAVSASSQAFRTSPGESPAVLNAQLAKYQRQLADWKNCPSCKTPEGKAKIAAIEKQISDVESRIKSSESAKPARNDAGNGGSAPTAAPAAQDAPLGRLINLYA